tara:strand:+ start:323 stop:2143 length:1821 start_codon:yes stop_codon:yes gene_type:complete
MSILLVIGSDSIGDVLCATPTIRKLYNTYGHKLDVATFRPNVLKNNPYIENIINRTITNFNEEEYFHTHEISSWCKFLPQEATLKSKEVVLKHNVFDIRRYCSVALGFDLISDEMSCDFYPDAYEEIVPFDEYVCIHPSETWQSRTWDKSKWQALLEGLLNLGKNLVILGKTEDKKEAGQWGGSKPIYSLSIPEGYSDQVLDLTNKADLSQTWHILNAASCVITMDTGILHLAGTTDVEIVQLGSSIDYKFRAPYRNGKQDYKYKYIGGSCDIFCASSLKHALKEHGQIQSIPPLWKCLEDKESFECHPSVDQVLGLFEPYEYFKKFELTDWQKELGIEKYKMYFYDTKDDHRNKERGSGLDINDNWAIDIWDELIKSRSYEKHYKIKQDDVVFDIGANIGFFTTSISQRNIAHCYSFEPMPLNYKYLKKNVSILNDSEKFSTINKAISNQEEVFVDETAIDLGSPWSVKEASEGCLTLESIKLSDFAKENNIEKINFFKMDAEGAEYDIFEDEKEFEWLLNVCENVSMEIHNDFYNSGTPNRSRFKVDYFKKFISRGFDVKFYSVDGYHVTDAVLRNDFLEDVGQFAHEYYNQIIFHANKKKELV